MKFLYILSRPNMDDVYALSFDELVPDDVIEREYGGICFVEDDFFCTARNI